jgi:hypothetical protein
VRLSVVVAYAVSAQNIEGLRLSVNGQELDYRRSTSNGNYVLEAEFDDRAAGAEPLLNVELRVPQLDSLPDAKREFGVAVRRVAISAVRD